MEILTLATTALTLAAPFITKAAEKASEKIGEDIWDLIKKPFLKENKNIDKLSQEEIKVELVKMLENNPDFKKELEDLVNSKQSQQAISQNIINEGSIEKQVNIGSNVGDISL